MSGENKDRHFLLSAFVVLHPLTDVCSSALYVLASGGRWQAVLYNFVAFLLQLPIGWVLDAYPISLRLLMVIAAGLMGVGIVEYTVFGDPVVAIAIVCLGNAVFHVAAGKHLLDRSHGRATDVSLYISTGAIGLIAGLRFGSAINCWFLFGMLLVFVFVVVFVWELMQDRLGDGLLHPLLQKVRPLEIAALVVLLLLVTWRSYGVLTSTSGYNSRYSSIALLSALVLSSVIGQALSGLLSDRWGRYKILAISLLGSAALFWACPDDCVWGWVALMFVAQLATGPVLSLLFAICHGRGGFAFGLNGLALFASTLFIYFPPAMMFYLAGDWLAIALEFAATAWVKLPRWFLSIVVVNLITHPALTYAVSCIGYSMPVVVTGEVSVVVVEGLILYLFYHRYVRWMKMLMIAAWMNAISYFTGVCLFGLGW